MEYITLDDFIKLLKAGYLRLNSKKKIVDNLNVFPVPDGDTGTNMVSTLQAIIDNLPASDFSELAEVVSREGLLGARGNSGVILSQFLTGFMEKIKNKSQLTTEDISAGLSQGCKYAYAGIGNPVEGTILTVMRKVSEKAREICSSEKDILSFLKSILSTAQNVLEQTPKMLPILKTAGVVDAGGCGFVYIIEGAVLCLEGKSVEEKAINLHLPTLNEIWAKILVDRQEKAKEGAPLKFKIRKYFYLPGLKQAGINTKKLFRQLKIKRIEDFSEFGEKMAKVWSQVPERRYCTEFILKPEKEIEQEEIKKQIEEHGISTVISGSSKLMHIHIHTDNPEIILDTASKIGKVSQVKIDDMYEQQKQFLQSKNLPNKEGAAQIIAVANGPGLKEIFLSMGVSKVVEGGKTMNPSVKDFLLAINSLPPGPVIILPNNKNVIFTAQRAAQLSEKLVEVLPTKNIPQGFSALIHFNPQSSLLDNLEMMKEGFSLVKVLEITHATRELIQQDKAIHKGDIIGIYENNIIAYGRDANKVAVQAVEKLIGQEFPDCQLISIYYGKKVNRIRAHFLYENLKKNYISLDIQLYFGGQPYRYYIISFE